MPNNSQTEEIITQNDSIDLGFGLTIDSIQDKVYTKVYGVGIRQALAPAKFFIIPVISVGVAKQIKTGKIVYTFGDNGEKRMVEKSREELISGSVFGTFLLKLNFTETLSLNGSVRTVFKAVDFNAAKDSLKYEAGISWMF